MSRKKLTLVAGTFIVTQAPYTDLLEYYRDWGRDYLTFDHLLSGYDAGFYGYMYSRVFSADMFHTAFKHDPMDKVQGRRYRRLILERGGSIDEMDSLVEFLGREPNSDAFQKEELGLE